MSIIIKNNKLFINNEELDLSFFKINSSRNNNSITGQRDINFKFNYKIQNIDYLKNEDTVIITWHDDHKEKFLNFSNFNFINNIK